MMHRVERIGQCYLDVDDDYRHVFARVRLLWSKRSFHHYHHRSIHHSHHIIMSLVIAARAHDFLYGINQMETHRWMNVWMCEWMCEWMDRWMCE